MKSLSLDVRCSCAMLDVINHAVRHKSFRLAGFGRPYPLGLDNHLTRSNKDG